jgi:hypothetical protein
MPVLQSGDSFSTAVSLGDAAKRCAERTKDEVTAGTAYVPPPRPKPKAPPPAPKLGHDEERQMEEEAAKEAGWETVTGMARGSNNVHSPSSLPRLSSSSLSLSLSLSLFSVSVSLTHIIISLLSLCLSLSLSLSLPPSPPIHPPSLFARIPQG